MATTGDNREGSYEAPNNLDDLFDYDVGIEDIMNNDVSAQANNTSNSNNQNRPTGSKDATTGLGLDEEVAVSKKRKPTVKFDEPRLLSQAGIPKLRKTAKTKLKFKGKGHEFSDAARLLNFYQLWLDDLFPRAKFADGLSMIEKLGHSKRMQVMRREWIDEGKPKLYYEDEDNNGENTTNTNPAESASNTASGEQRTTTRSTEPDQSNPLAENTTAQQPGDTVPSIFGGGGNTASSRPSAPNYDDDDGLFFTDDEDNNNNTSAPKANDAIPEDDDLDALLAEQDAMEAEASGNAPKSNNNTTGGAWPGAQRPPDDDEFADEMEAMADMENPW